MKIILLISSIAASMNCMEDKGLDLYSKYADQTQNHPNGSDLTSYMASPVSQNILQQNTNYGSPSELSYNTMPGQGSGCYDRRQMYYMQGRTPFSQGGLISSLMGNQHNQNTIPSYCGKNREEDQYRNCINKQIQDIKNMIMTCKSIYGEDNNMCNINGGSLPGINDLNVTTKTGIPCLDAMTFNGLGPVSNTMQSALYTSNRSSYNPQEGLNYTSIARYPPNNNMNMPISSDPNTMCETIPQSFCKMMKGPILGQQTPKTCSYQGDIVNINDYCKKDDCKDGCPRQNDCKKTISGPSGCSTNSNLSNTQPNQFGNLSNNQPNQFGNMPYIQPTPYYGPNPYSQLNINYGTNQPNVLCSSNQQPNLMYPNITTNGQNYCNPTSSLDRNKRTSNDKRYNNQIPIDGMILIEPNTSLHNYITNIITDPNRIRIIGDEQSTTNKKTGSKKTSSSLVRDNQESSVSEEEEPVKDKKPNKKRTVKRKPKNTEDSSETQNVFQDIEEDSLIKNNQSKRYVHLKKKCMALAENEKEKNMKACAKFLETGED